MPDWLLTKICNNIMFVKTTKKKVYKTFFCCFALVSFKEI
jgi:hypothetical protein